ncbi:alpha-galactosidase [Microbacterium aquimaris]|uniref:alpha-galactosidase n=1 Tax=Microbacterium aquimaris TaxID=459816 RepID=A0ABU5N491_9MICO|nr:alpha-galactosidase [Microbacterium aquimaris]MDZ8160855.1 alpha-galactosidase [Microbacterium aquimaris]
MTASTSVSVRRTVSLRAAGVSLVLDLSDDLLPAVVHWGADLGSLTTEDEASALTDAGVNPVGLNQVDEPVRVAILPEGWTGWPGRPGLSGSRAGQAWSPRFRVTARTLDGSPVAAGLTEGGAGAVRVRAEDAASSLAVDLHVELLPAGILRTRAELSNLGADEYTLDAFTLALPIPSVAREVLDFAGRWARERTPQRTDLGIGIHLRENRRGRTGADSAYLLHAGAPGFDFAGGEVWAVHTAWSGNHVHYAERVFSGEQVLGGGELLLPGEIVLGAGDSYTSPWLYGAYGDGLDELAGRFHRHLRARRQHPSSPRPVTLNVWEAVYFDHSLPGLIELADRAAEIGVERYVLDDGWFGSRRDDTSGLGDWQVSAEVWPDGLGPLVDHVTGLGMQFGLWFEPEMVNVDSDVAHAHPEWIMSADRDRLPVPSRNQQVLNLAIPACYDYIRDAMVAILREYDISYIKWDHNRDLVEAADRADGRPAVHAQTLAFYRLVDELKESFPGLEIESCSSGGGRVDLEVIERTDRVWTSDCIDPHERQLMHRWTQQLLPPELMGAHIASGISHTTGRGHSLEYRASTAVFGHLGIEWDLRAAPADEFAQLGAWVAFYKRWRGLLHTGDVVRLDTGDETLFGHGVVSRDRSRALFAIAAVERSMTSMCGRVRLRGLDAGRRYRVRPVLPAGELAGMLPPPWWGTGAGDMAAHSAVSAERIAGGSGAVFSGRTLERVGVAHPAVFPDTTVLYEIEAVDSSRD